MTKATKPNALIYGIGINDADYTVNPRVRGKHVICPFYSAWKSMLLRCYSKGHLKKCPTYAGCSVSKEWLLFSNFKAWMETQDWRGMVLNKSILIPGNKLYSADACVFVSRGLNQILLDVERRNGPWPKGVYRPKKDGTFMAKLSVYGEIMYLGRFDSPKLAGDAYVRAKAWYIRDTATDQPDPVRSALFRHADLLEGRQ